MAAVSAITILNANPVQELYPLNNRELIGRGEHEYKDGGEVAGHGDSFLVCARARGCCMIGFTSDGTRHPAAPKAPHLEFSYTLVIGL